MSINCNERIWPKDCIQNSNSDFTFVLRCFVCIKSQKHPSSTSALWMYFLFNLRPTIPCMTSTRWTSKRSLEEEEVGQQDEQKFWIQATNHARLIFLMPEQKKNKVIYNHWQKKQPLSPEECPERGLLRLPYFHVCIKNLIPMKFTSWRSTRGLLFWLI